MHGHGYPPQQPPTRRPSSGTLTGLRVLFVALTLLSCGFLSWAALLRLAAVTRRTLDWSLMAGAVVLNGSMVAFILGIPEDEPELTDQQAVVLLGWMLCSVAGTIAYYLYAEIRHYAPGGGLAPSPYAGHLPPAAPPVTSAPGYAYPPAPARTSAPLPPPPPTRTPVPPPAQPATPQRMDQVRAELDELSDYLRKEGGSR
ncbi:MULTISPECIES: hypothetical protein [Streptomyces]|uniref:Integral membrane protein n=1 Tax=Streptomyces flavovirens TaxID=52258 RepID=A0ABV8NDW9_9ACTN